MSSRAATHSSSSNDDNDNDDNDNDDYDTYDVDDTTASIAALGSIDDDDGDLLSSELDATTGFAATATDDTIIGDRTTTTTTSSRQKNVTTSQYTGNSNRAAASATSGPAAAAVAVTMASSVTTLSSQKKWSHVKNCAAHWPRTMAILQKMILLWSLIIIALFLGYLLSIFEGPGEAQSNDLILQQRWFLATLPIQQLFVALINMPTACMEQVFYTNADFLRDTLLLNNATIADLTLSTPLITLNDNDYYNTTDGSVSNSSYSLAELIQEYWPEFELPPVPILLKSNNDAYNNNDPSTKIDEILEILHQYLELCEEASRQLVEKSLNFTSEYALENFDFRNNGISIGPGSLTFNWIRCWNNTELGNPNPWSPTQEQITASTNQAIFYTQVWQQNQQQLYEQYVEEYNCYSLQNDNNDTNSNNVTSQGKCLLDALHQSVMDATGYSECDPNTGSSAWFWFTVMTTVGYGNQSPVSRGGRSLVAALGWLSIIAFGGIIVYSATTWTAVVDDLFRRAKLPYLARPIYAAMVWGVISIIWLVCIAARARSWWTARVPDFEYTVPDSYWFAYITTLTVGLGDFYLQPEGLFVSDVFSWASTLLTGFVVITICLGKVGNFFVSILPQGQESLADYLARTDDCGNVIGPPGSKTVNTLKELVEENKEKQPESRFGNRGDRSMAIAKDGQTINIHRIQQLIEKKNLLIQLLHDTQNEVDDRMMKAGYDIEGAISNIIPILVENSSSNKDSGLEYLRHEEQVLATSLERTREIRVYLENIQVEQHL